MNAIAVAAVFGVEANKVVNTTPVVSGGFRVSGTVWQPQLGASW